MRTFRGADRGLEPRAFPRACRAVVQLVEGQSLGPVGYRVAETDDSLDERCGYGRAYDDGGTDREEHFFALRLSARFMAARSPLKSLALP